jgi:hypothetical protein
MLLVTNPAKLTGSRNYIKLHRAAWLLAQREHGVRELARMAGIAPNTASQLIKEAKAQEGQPSKRFHYKLDFRELVESCREWLRFLDEFVETSRKREASDPF